MKKRVLSSNLLRLRSSMLGNTRIIPVLVALAVGQTGKAAPSGSGTTRSGGDYEYVDGAYQRPTDLLINGSLDTLSAAGGTVTQAQHFLNNATSFGLRREFSPGTGGAAVNGGLGLILQGPFLLGGDTALTPTPQRSIWTELRLGPLYLDNVYGGVGAIYSDYQGSPPFGGPGFHAGGDNWAGIIWASARATTYITNRFALILNPSVYYLPLTNQVGWAVGSPFLGLGNGQLTPSAILQMAYRVPLEGGYNLVFSDWFGAYYQANTLLNQSMFFQTALGDTTPVDYAGRYQFPWGGIGGYQTTTRSSTNFSVRDSQFDQQRMNFQNWASLQLLGQHGDHIRSSIYFNRTDFWDYGFNHSPGWNNLGAVIMQQGPVFSPYAFYQLSTQDDFRSRYQQAVVGTNAQLSPNLLAYAQAGILWGEQRLPSGASNPYSTWIAQTGFRQRLGPYTLHGLDVGRNILGNNGSSNAQFISNFVRYYATQQFGLRTAASLYAEKANQTLVGGGGASTSDRELLTIGAMLQSQLSARSSLSLFASYDQIHMTQIARGWDMWTYRAAYTRQLGVSMQASINYQYQQVGAGVSIFDSSFQEHFLFMGLSKRF